MRISNRAPAKPSVDTSDFTSGSTIWSVRWQSIIAILAVLVVTLVVFLPIRHFQFALIDDDANVYNNLQIRNPQAQNIAFFWRTPYYELYMPVTSTIWALLVRVAWSKTPHLVPPGGGYTSHVTPYAFHVASLCLHAGVVAVVFLILRRLRFAPWPSAAGALAFAIHPVQIQAVAWITGMNNLTGALFGLLALYVYSLQFGEQSRPAVRNEKAQGAGRYVLLVASTLLFVAGLLGKPTTVVIPMFIAVLELLVWRRPLRNWGGLMGLWMFFSAICALITGSAALEATKFVWSPLWGRPFVALDSLAFYLTKLAYPVNLTFDYTRTPHSVLTNWWGYATWPLPVLVFSFLWFGSKTRAESTAGSIGNRPDSRVWLRVASLIFVLGLLPTLGIVPNYSQVVSSVFDRYLYIAMLGPAILLAHVLSRPRRKPAVTYVIVIAALSLLTFETMAQLPSWTDMNTLTNQMLIANPNSSIGHHDKGLILGALDDLPGALREFEIEVAIQHATNARADFYLGVTLFEMGKYDEAVSPLNSAFRMARSDREYWYQLWNALAVLNRLDEAEVVVRKHLAVDASDGRAVFTLGKMLATRGDPAEALTYLEKARGDQPNEPAIPFFMGVALEKLGRKADAITAYERARQLDPSRQETADRILRLREGK